MATKTHLTHVMEAVRVLKLSTLRVSDDHARELLVCMRLLRAAERIASRWPGPVDAGAEPKALKLALDEIRFRLHTEPLLEGDDAQRQFYHRALCAALALGTRRMNILRGAGRCGPQREIDAESRAMVEGFDAARLYAGQHAPVGAGAAIQDAFTLGAIGGSWASVLLDSEPLPARLKPRYTEQERRDILSGTLTASPRAVQEAERQGGQG